MKIKDRIAKLIDVKTFVTFALTGVFVYLCVCGKIEPQIFMTIYSVTVSFYFGTQYEKNNPNRKE